MMRALAINEPTTTPLSVALGKLAAISAFADCIATERPPVHDGGWVDPESLRLGEAHAYAHCAARLREIIGV